MIDWLIDYLMLFLSFWDCVVQNWGKTVQTIILKECEQKVSCHKMKGIKWGFLQFKTEKKWCLLQSTDKYVQWPFAICYSLVPVSGFPARGPIFIFLSQ